VFVGFCHYVEEEDRSAWESYTGVDSSNYLIDSYNYFDSMGIPSVKVNELISVDWMVPGKVLPIYDLLMNGTIIPDPGPGPYLVSLFLGQCVTLYSRKHLHLIISLKFCISACLAGLSIGYVSTSGVKSCEAAVLRDGCKSIYAYANSGCWRSHSY
jgi:hypothetical protein